MLNLTILSELFTNGFRFSYIYVISFFSIILGVSTIIANNPVYSVLFLIGLFLGVSLYFFSCDLDFIGLAYLLVYVGAVSILFIFILMLINIRVSELLTEGLNSIPLAIIIVLCFNYTINPILPNYIFSDIFSYLLHLSKLTYNFLSHLILNNNILIIADNNYLVLASVSSKSWEKYLVGFNHISSIGNVLYTTYFIALILISLIILLAMVGAIVLTVTKKASGNMSVNIKPMELKNSIFTITNTLILNTIANIVLTTYNNLKYNFKSTFTKFKSYR